MVWQCPACIDYKFFSSVIQLFFSFQQIIRFESKSDGNMIRIRAHGSMFSVVELCLRRWIRYHWNEYVKMIFFLFLVFFSAFDSDWSWIVRNAVFVKLIFWSKYWTDVFFVFYYLFFGNDYITKRGGLVTPWPMGKGNFRLEIFGSHCGKCKENSSEEKSIGTYPNTIVTHRRPFGSKSLLSNSTKKYATRFQFRIIWVFIHLLFFLRTICWNCRNWFFSCFLSSLQIVINAWRQTTTLWIMINNTKNMQLLTS